MEAISVEDATFIGILMFVFLNLLDVMTTYTAIRIRRTYDVEVNPIARWLFKKLGFKAMFILKNMGMTAILIALSEADPVNALGYLYLFNAIMGLVVAWNSYALYRMTKEITA